MVYASERENHININRIVPKQETRSSAESTKIRVREKEDEKAREKKNVQTK